MNLCMDIADVRFDIQAQPPMDMDGFGPAYAPFVSGQKSSRQPDVHIRVHAQNTPRPANAERVFHGGKSWSLFRSQKDWWISMDPQDNGAPIWSARMNKNFSQAEVFCGPEMAPAGAPHALGSNPVGYPLAQILLMYNLAQRSGALIHAAGIVRKNRAFLFAGPSGAGKSTLTQRLAKQKGITVLSDDRIALRRHPQGHTAYGTPWAGTANTALDGSARLGGVFFLRKAGRTRVLPLKPARAMEKILPLTSAPWYDPVSLEPILDTLESLCQREPVFELKCALDAKEDLALVECLDQI